jgi:hypothetical protein
MEETSMSVKSTPVEPAAMPAPVKIAAAATTTTPVPTAAAAAVTAATTTSSAPMCHRIGGRDL